MRRPRWEFTTRALIFAVVLIAFNLAGLRATLSCYPLPRKPPPIIFGENKGIYIHFSGYRDDGRFEEWFADPATGATSPHRVWPSPHPTLLRIWSPALSTLALSLLAVALASGRLPRPRMTPRRLAIAMPAAILAIWLILPLAEIVANPRRDYHTHSDNRTVHREPFWPRYARRLMGRPWPDDYICPDYPASAGPRPRMNRRRGFPFGTDPPHQITPRIWESAEVRQTVPAGSAAWPRSATSVASHPHRPHGG